MSAEGKLLRLIESLQGINPEQTEFYMRVDGDTFNGISRTIKASMEEAPKGVEYRGFVDGKYEEMHDGMAFTMNGITIYVTLMK